MKKIRTTNLGIVIGFLFLIIGICVGIALSYENGKVLSKDTQQITWKKYDSAISHVSFEYPSEWRVEEHVITDYYITGQKQPLQTNSLWICPAPKEGLNNCIEFYIKSRILNPVPGFYDESQIFKDFTSYIQYSGNGYDNFRISEQNSSDDQGVIRDLTGLYRAGQNFIGMFQVSCAKDKSTECFFVFKHVLDSIRFLSESV